VKDRPLLAIAAAFCAIGLAACGSSGSRHGAALSATAQGGQPSGAAALTAEAQSAATGDIPDNQVFLTYHDTGGGYAVKFPEGWARRGTGADVTFSEKNNLIHIVVAAGAVPTVASVRAELARVRASTPSLGFTSPAPVRLGSGPAIRVTYTTLGAPNPVTGKRVQLLVDRYELARGGRRATVDLGTARGVDNVDAYRMIINSFRWR